jgi:hypothetical protein
LVYHKGDRVYVVKKEERTDDLETFVKISGEVVEAFNAWDPVEGDRWEYRIKGKKGEYILFYENRDEGTITLMPK